LALAGGAFFGKESQSDSRHRVDSSVTAPKGLPYDAFAVAPPGLEPLVAMELRSLGVSKIVLVAGGVEFKCDAQGLARVNLSVRTASRVTVRLAHFVATDFRVLEGGARKVEWARWISPGTRVRLRVTCKKSKLYHSDAVAQRVEAEIVRAVKGALLEHAAGDEDGEDDLSTESASQMIVVRLDHDRCTISADSSGELLYRRGYRLDIGKAPLRETLAAAMLLGSPYDPTLGFADPMCGSGTIAIEAAMIARRIAPGLERRFAAEQWPEMNAGAWKAARETARGRILPSAAAPIVASDRDGGAVEAAMENAKRAGVAKDVEITQAALSAFEPPTVQGLMLVNPPYGVRVGDTKQLRDLFARLGQVARTKAPLWRVGMLSADRDLERQTDLDLVEVFATKNGGIPVRLMLAEPG
jgi:putative N6-adenine-specific DNA methylase